MPGHSHKRRRAGDHGGGEHENSERWLLTYADMITLLVAFFIMLYAMSIMNQQKFQQLAISVRSGFGGSIMNGAPTVISQGGGITGTPSIVSNSTSISSSEEKSQFPPTRSQQEAARRDKERLDKAYQIMQAYITKKGLQDQMHVRRDERGVVVTVLTDKMLFASGQADLRPEEGGLLGKIAAVLNTVPNTVRVEGHTDNLPIHTARFASNWELSALRATTVLRYFASQGVAPRRLEATGDADQHPVAPNDTEDHRRCNRRVDVVILKQI